MAKMNEYDKTLIPKSLQIHWTLETQLAASWLEAVPEQIKKLGDKRIREFAASRHSLAQVCTLQDMDQLEIQDHHHLKLVPSIMVSLSHTRGISAAICSNEHRSVGIDIEHHDRRFKPEIAKFFKTPEDDQLELLELWSIKEAGFKAVDPMGLKKILVLKDLVVKKDSILFENKAVAKWNCQRHNGLITSIAWVD